MSATVQTGYFFMPEHIILVGASERPHSLGERIFSHLLGSSYQGKITPVNLRHSSVAGIPSYSSLSKIPGQADLVVAVIPPDHYDSLFKACRKKDLRHIILIQDWENLPPESCKNARSIIQKHHGDELNISVCNSAGIQLPSLNLNISTQADYPAGHIALLTGHSTVSRNINHLLNTLHQGVSRHISLNYDLSPPPTGSTASVTIAIPKLPLSTTIRLKTNASCSVPSATLHATLRLSCCPHTTPTTQTKPSCAASAAIAISNRYSIPPNWKQP